MWGLYEGLLLFWIWLLVFWVVGVVIFICKMLEEVVVCVLSVMGLISIGFMVFIIFSLNLFNCIFFDFFVDGCEFNLML